MSHGLNRPIKIIHRTGVGHTELGVCIERLQWWVSRVTCAPQAISMIGEQKRCWPQSDA